MSTEADPPIPATGPFIDPAATEINDMALAFFARDSQDRLVCLKCGSVVAEGWEGKHFYELHVPFRRGF